MNKKEQDETTQAIHDFRDACNRLAELINRRLFEDCRDWWWVGDEVGGTCCFDDDDYLTPEEMVLILEEGVSYDQYEEWHCANLDHDDYINLYSWLRGCRHDMLNKSKEDNNNNSNQQDNESKD